jgi:thymidylate synthase
MKKYLEIVDNVLTNGVFKSDRTGTGCISVAGQFFEHDMSEGYPLLTTKRVPFNLVASELEFFIRGFTDKQWLIDRNNHIWDEWCSPDKVPYGHDPETLQAMKDERDLGPLYGFQWRHYNGKYTDYNDNSISFSSNPIETGVDQLWNLVKMLKTNPDDRRMLVVAWNPMMNNRMALPPCHWAFQVTVTGGKLNLMWNQRSCDLFLGIPLNIASYALLLHLLAKESGLGEGRLCGFLGDTHIYSTHTEQVKNQLLRIPYELPTIQTPNFTSIFDWKYTDTEVIGYKHHPGIKALIAV